MGSIQNMVHYCCVSKGNQILYEYSKGDHAIENVAALCLERTPPFHKWYFETIGKKTFGFLIDGGFVYFAIADDGLKNRVVLQLLECIRDEFKNVAKRGSRGSFLGMNSVGIQEQLVLVIRHLIASLEHVSQSGNRLMNLENSLPDHAGFSPSPSNANAQTEVVSSTKAPLLGKSCKPEKKKPKDHVSAARDIELQEHRKSTDRGTMVDPTTVDPNDQTGSHSSVSLPKDLSPVRARSTSQNIQKKWRRQVQIVLAIDAAVCLALFVIWLSVCNGIKCIR